MSKKLKKDEYAVLLQVRQLLESHIEVLYCLHNSPSRDLDSGLDILNAYDEVIARHMPTVYQYGEVSTEEGWL